jgi:hypothetical protein
VRLDEDAGLTKQQFHVHLASRHEADVYTRLRSKGRRLVRLRVVVYASQHMSDQPTSVKHTDSILAEERGAVSALLEANAGRREAAEVELRAARQALQDLLLRGHAAGMQVADMARKAQISRDTAHRALNATLKETGQMTWKEKQAWASEVMAHIPGGDHEKNEFRMFVNMLLLKALGKNPEGLPQSVEGLLDEATRDMKRVAGKPNFKPEYDPAILTLAWPGASAGRTTGRARRRRASAQDAATEALPGRERSPRAHPANHGGTMKTLSWKLAAAAAILAVVLAPTAAASASRPPRVKLSLVSLPKSALGTVGRSLPLSRDSGVVDNLDASYKTVAAKTNTFGKLGRITGYDLTYGDRYRGGPGVTEISTGADVYRTAADARHGLAFLRNDDPKFAVLDPFGLGVTVKALKPAKVGTRRFAKGITYTAPNATSVLLDEQFAVGRYVLHADVAAGSLAAATPVAAGLARNLDHRLRLAETGHLRGKPVELPPQRKAGPPLSGPSLPALALTAGDVGGQATVGDSQYLNLPLGSPSLSEYGVLMQPAGRFWGLLQEVDWYPSANDAAVYGRFTGAAYLYILTQGLVPGSFGQFTPVDLSGIGDNAYGGIVTVNQSPQPPSYDTIVVLSSGQASDVIDASSQTQIQAADVVNLAQAAANRLNTGLGGQP